jgi:hypothetical protein
MAWGFGSVGYARFRARAILENTINAEEKLLAVARTVADDGPLQAYRRLSRADDCQIRGFGPSFGTKYLYFLQPKDHDTTALILNQFVASWLSRWTELALNPVPWSPPTYQRYLDHMHEWASILDCRPDEVEYCIFQAAASSRGSQWSVSSSREVDDRPASQEADDADDEDELDAGVPMTILLTPDEMERLGEAARAERRAIQDVARTAVVRYLRDQG